MYDKSEIVQLYHYMHGFVFSSNLYFSVENV